MARPREFNEAEALDAAVQVFREKGFQSCSLDDLTERMGIQRASLYNTFGDKQALFLQALAAYQARSLRWMEGRLVRPGPVRTVIRELFDTLGEREADGAGCLCVNSMIERGPHDPAVARALDRHQLMVEDLLRQALERGRAAGEFPPGFDCTATSRFLGSVLTSLAVLRKTGADPGRMADVRRVALSVLG